MTTPDPEPRRTAGLESGGGMSSGQTPPAEGGTFGISTPSQLHKDWAPSPLEDSFPCGGRNGHPPMNRQADP
ncbi:DUF6480 family protein [Streptomyces sp. NPDC002265]|uniref:DUF6480 family protein n=1 Tax=Streptomyces sp. NPDC002265 TaxID=3154415 RepID=UPI00332E507F